MINKYLILAFTFLSLLVTQNSRAQDYDLSNPESFQLNDFIQACEDAGAQISTYDNLNDYISDVNNDSNVYNDFIDLNYDGVINANDHLDRQILTNIYGLPANISEEDLQAILASSTQLREVIIEKDKGPVSDPNPVDPNDPNNNDSGTEPPGNDPPGNDPPKEPCSLIGCTSSNMRVDYDKCECVPIPISWYLDNDEDGWHSEETEAAESPGLAWKRTTSGMDCNDTDATVTSDCYQNYFIDKDRDGWDSGTVLAMDSHGGIYKTTTNGTDCDDSKYSLENKCDDDCKTSKDDLKLLFPNLTDEKAQLLADTLNKFSKFYGIDTKEKLQHFLAQVGHESNDFKTFGEYTNHQPKNILSGAFSGYFNDFGHEGENPTRTDISSIYTDGDKYVNGEKFLNIIYDDRNPNRINKIGNIYDGDGYKFRGRGALQITGRDNYTNFTTFYNSISDSTPKDFTNTPDELKNNFEISVHASLWFFQKYVLDGVNNFQTRATNVDEKVQDRLIKKVSKVVNGGNTGLADRITRLKDAKTKIDCN